MMPRIVMRVDTSLDGIGAPLTQARLRVGLRDGRTLEAAADGALLLARLTAAAATYAGAKAGDFRGSITNAAGAQAYPIAAFTYFLVPEKFADPAKAQCMTNFLRWMLTFGQKESASLGYAALPEVLATQALEIVGGRQ